MSLVENGRTSRPGPEFRIASRDELWIDGLLAESRLSYGRAGHRDGSIHADDSRDDELVDRCERGIALLREKVPVDATARLFSSARRIAGTVITEQLMTISINGTTALTSDAASLRSVLAQQGSGGRDERPLVWRNGTGAVLLHEAAGHAAEHGAKPVAWPSWLAVHDEPSFAIDDRGQPVLAADLLTSPPACFRRATFRDVPLQRMTNVIVRQHGAPSALPASHIDIYLIGGGLYDPATDLVTIDVTVSSAGPFTYLATRAAVAASLIGAIGEPQAYPGVICSREGQALHVGSASPVLVMR